jgi:hypothetical protein
VSPDNESKDTAMDGGFASVPGSPEPALEGDHLSSRSVAALAHDESAGFGEAMLTLIRDHASGCHACAARVRTAAEQDDATAALLRCLDAPAPRVSARAVIARARRQRRLTRARIAAAVAALCGAAVTAAALPSSPFHRHVIRVLAAIAPTPRSAAPAADSAPAPAPAPQRGGIALTPGERLDVVFSQPQRSGTLHLTLADTVMATLSSTDSPASYQVGEDRIVVVNTHPGGSYDLVIPRTLRHVSVRVGAAVVFQRDGERVTALAPRDAGGGYTIPLVR